MYTSFVRQPETDSHDVTKCNTRLAPGGVRRRLDLDEEHVDNQCAASFESNTEKSIDDSIRQRGEDNATPCKKIKLGNSSSNDLATPSQQHQQSESPRRRSARSRRDKNQRAVYKFEKIVDYTGNLIIVPSVEMSASAKPRYDPSAYFEQLQAKKKRAAIMSKSSKLVKTKQPSKKRALVTKKRSKSISAASCDPLATQTSPLDEMVKSELQSASVVYASSHLVCDERDAASDKRNNATKYMTCTGGIAIQALSATDGIIRLEADAKTCLNNHDVLCTYFVQQGKCTVSIDGVETSLSIADVIKIPASTMYTIQNVSDPNCKAFLYFSLHK